MDPINPAQIPNSHLVKSASIHIHAIMAGARIPTYTVLKTTPDIARHRKCWIRRL